jgi:hypothetical protein
MRIVLTNHARLRAIQRNIWFEEIVDCVMQPDHTHDQWDSLICYKKLWSTYVLLVYTKHQNGNIVVITVLKTSQIKKYYP